jgi:hypothetical protein
MLSTQNRDREGADSPTEVNMSKKPKSAPIKITKPPKKTLKDDGKPYLYGLTRQQLLGVLRSWGFKTDNLEL